MSPVAARTHRLSRGGSINVEGNNMTALRSPPRSINPGLRSYIGRGPRGGVSLSLRVLGGGRESFVPSIWKKDSLHQKGEGRTTVVQCLDHSLCFR